MREHAHAEDAALSCAANVAGEDGGHFLDEVRRSRSRRRKARQSWWVADGR